MNLPSSRRLRALPALLGLGVVASSMLGIAPGAAPAVAAGEPVQLVLAPANGGVVQPGADVTVTASLTNTGSTTIEAASLQVALDREVISTRAGLAEWLTPTGDESTVDNDAIITDVAVPALQPGEERIVQAVIPAPSVTLDEWGVRGITGTLEQGDGTESVTHSSIVFNAADAPAATRVAVAIPITTQPGQTGLIPEATLATITADDGLLTRELDSLIGRPIGILIDPRIIVSIRALGSTAPSSATSWLERLEAASNPIYPLSYADADVAAMSQAGAPQLLTPTSFDYALDEANFADVAPPTTSPTPPAGTPAVGPSSETPTPAPSPAPDAVPDTNTLLAFDYTGSTIAWPRDNTVAANDVPYFAANGLTSSILSSSNVALQSSASAGVVRVGDSTVLVSDDTVSRALRDAAGALTATDRQKSLSDLASGLAVVASEDDGTATTILATLDRAAPADGTALADALNSLDTLSWSSTTPFDGFSTQGPAADATVVDQPEAADRTGQVAALLASENQVAAFSSIITEPQNLLGENRANILSLLANSWASNSGGWNVAIEAQAARSAEILNSVAIVAGSPINLVSNTGDMPILVQNNLPYPVNVTVRLAPSNFRLVVQKEVTITVEAASSKQAKVPITAGVANGDTIVRAELVSPTGVLISAQPTFVPVNVSADWEVAGSWLVGSVVGALLIFAAIRLFLKRRHGRGEADAAEASAAPAPDAAAPAAATGTETDIEESRG
jgi:hypothetical protein